MPSLRCQAEGCEWGTMTEVVQGHAGDLNAVTESYPCPSCAGTGLVQCGRCRREPAVELDAGAHPRCGTCLDAEEG